MKRTVYAAGVVLAVIATATTSLLIRLLFDFVLADPFSPSIGRVRVTSPFEVIAIEYFWTFDVLSL